MMESHPKAATEWKLRPLRELGRPGALTRRIPHLARRMLQTAYARRYIRTFCRGHYDGSFEPNHLAVRVTGPVVTTIHDLSVLDHPEWHPSDRLASWENDLPATLESTTHFVAVSQFTRARMIERLGISPERITAIALAARTLQLTADFSGRARAAGLPEAFLLHLGTLEPRKNIPLLLDAWHALPPQAKSCKLVLAGGTGWGSEEHYRRLIDHPAGGEVLWAGYVSHEQAAGLLAAARAVLVPSSYEGFGLPILEAMAAGAPVICSTAEAFTEIAGAATERIDPADGPAWTAAIRRGIEDASWREELSRRGRAQAAKFSWQQTAAAHAKLFELIFAAFA